MRTTSSLVVLSLLVVLAAGCGGQSAKPSPAATAMPSTATPSGQTPAAGAAGSPTPEARPSPTPASTPEPTALPSDLRITWGEWWYEGEYLANPEKYPADPAYHDRSFNIRVTIRNTSSQILPGDVLPVFYLTDGEGERPVITWYYSPDDLRPLKPGEQKEAVFRALTYAPNQWIARAEIQWRGQVWAKEFPRK